jgi:RND family efflux transporter MFP subunit
MAHSAGSRPAIPVIAEPVDFQAQRSRIEAVGTSRALVSAEIHAESAGEVVAVHFSGGERVEEGQLLLELDARDERLNLELAQVQLENARLLLERYQTARGNEAVSVTTLDGARTAESAASIEVDLAQLALENRYVRAPFDGIIGLTDVEPGDRIDASTLITTLDDRSALLVAFAVPESFVGRVAQGDMVEVESWTADRITASGEVVVLGSRIDPDTRSVLARARIPNPEDALRPGMSFRVLLELPGAIWPSVPEVALQWGGSGPYIWAVRENRAERVDVRVVQRVQGRILLEAPLVEDDRVVAEGVQRMRQGTPVELLDPRALATDARAALGAALGGE